MKKTIMFVIFVFVCLMGINNVNAASLNFEGIGHYRFLTAGAHNIQIKQDEADKITADVVNKFNNGEYPWNGQAYDPSYAIYYINRLGNSIPINARGFVKDKSNISAIDNDSSIYNLSGSYLDVTGKVKKAVLNYNANIEICLTGQCLTASDLVVRKYAGILYPPDYATNKETLTITSIYTDITDFVNKHGKGYYYVSVTNEIVNNSITNKPYILTEAEGITYRALWTITAVEENATKVPNFRYIQLKSNAGKIYGTTYTGNRELDLEIPLAINVMDNAKAQIEITAYDGDVDTGTFSYNPSHSDVGDEAYVVANGKSYNLATIINDGKRQPHDFFKSVSDTTRKTSFNYAYESDVLNFDLDSKYVGDELKLNLKAIGLISYVDITTIGIGVDVENPTMSVTPTIERETDGKIKSTVTIKNTSDYNSCNNVLIIPIDPKLENVSDIEYSSTPKATAVLSKDKTYITVTFNEIFPSKGNFTISYKSDLKDTESGQINLDPTLSFFPASKNECPAEITGNDNLKQTETGHGETTINPATINITKINSYTNGAVQGAVFALYKSDGTTRATTINGKEVANITTDAEGKASFTNILGGTYIIREVTTPDGYYDSSIVNTNNDTTVTATTGSTLNKTIKNTPLGSIKIIKIDSETKKAVSGAEFELYKCESLTSCEKPTRITKDAYNKNLETIKTETNGEVVIDDLTYGDYLLIESKNPAGYVILSSSKKIRVEKLESEGTTDITIENTPVQLNITKYDFHTKQSLAGATIVITDVNSGAITEEFITTTDEISINMMPGEYLLTEKISPKGYQVLNENIRISINDKGSVTILNITDKDSKKVITENNSISIYDERTKLQISKSDISDGSLIKGATLKLMKADGTTVMDIVTEKEIEFVSEEVPNEFYIEAGEYKLQEVEAPKGESEACVKKIEEFKQEGYDIKGFNCSYEKIESPLAFKFTDEGNVELLGDDNEYYFLESNRIVVYNGSLPVPVPDTGAFTSIITILVGAAVAYTGYVFIKKKKNA